MRNPHGYAVRYPGDAAKAQVADLGADLAPSRDMGVARTDRPGKRSDAGSRVPDVGHDRSSCRDRRATVARVVTWAVGISGFPTGGVAAADVRVTLQSRGGKPRYLRGAGVQKIYRVAPHVAVGFAGSIAIGFHAVAAAQWRWRRVPRGHVCWPREIAERLAHHMRRVWPRVPEAERRGGCELLVVGWLPESIDWYREIPGPDGKPWKVFDETTPQARSAVFTLRGPTFDVVCGETQVPTAIGQRIPVWIDELVEALRSSSGLDDRHLGIGAPIIASEMLRDATKRAFERLEHPSVSSNMQYVLVGPRDVMFSERHPEAPTIARGAREWLTLARSLGISPTATVA